MSSEIAEVTESSIKPMGAYICAVDDVPLDAGVCALINGQQVALFRTHDGLIFGLDDFDPYANASVLSRGLLGETQGQIYVASPMYKHRFDLATGVCLDGDKDVRVWKFHIQQGNIYTQSG